MLQFHINIKECSSGQTACYSLDGAGMNKGTNKKRSYANSLLSFLFVF